MAVAMKLIPKDSYCLKFPDDKEECKIDGIDITLDGAIIVGDRDNKKLKIYHPERQYHSSLEFEYEPVDVAVIGDSEVIVTLMDGLKFADQLYVVDIKSPDKPTLKEKIKLGFKVGAVSVYEDKLIVNCFDDPRSVKMIDRTGRVYWSTSLDDKGEPLFAAPVRNTCFVENKALVVFIADTWFTNHSITKLNGDTGEVINVCKLAEPEYDVPGITHDARGNLFVSYRQTHGFAVLSSNLDCRKTLLTITEGLGPRPNTLTYNESNGELFVTFSFRSGRRNLVDCYIVS